MTSKKSVEITGKGIFADSTIDSFSDLEDIVVIDSIWNTGTAFEHLSKAKIHSAPVYDKKEAKWSGFFDVADMVTYVVDTLHKTSAPDVDMPSDFVDFKDMLLWINRNVPDSVLTASNLSSRNPFIPLQPGSSMLKLLEVLGERGVHRVPVMDMTSNDIKTIITQTDVANWLIQNPESLEAIKDETVESSKLGLKQLHIATLKTPLLSAFELMVQHNISTIPIVDDENDNKLISSLSDSDLRSMHQKRNLKIFGVTVMEFVKKVRDKDHREAISVTTDSTLVEVLESITTHHIHRIYIVNSQGQAIGIITLKEFLQHLYSRVKQVHVSWQ